jgi:hypothetical protein
MAYLSGPTPENDAFPLATAVIEDNASSESTQPPAGIKVKHCLLVQGTNEHESDIYPPMPKLEHITFFALSSKCKDYASFDGIGRSLLSK